MAVAGNLQNTADRTDTAAVRRRVSVAPHSQPEDTSCLHPEDSDNHAFFAAGRDLESVYVNHKYTKKERVTLSTYESLDYLPPHSKVYRDWLKRHPVSQVVFLFSAIKQFLTNQVFCDTKSYFCDLIRNRTVATINLFYFIVGDSEWDRWFMMGLIGLSVGLIGFLMHQLIDVIAETKWNTAAKIIDDKTYFIGWIFVIGYSVTFALASTMLVVFVRPSAGGSGIPELIGFLNGTIIRHIFNLRTLIVKFISCVFAVGSGLPVGPEGPMIHLGSMIGAGLSQLRSSTLGINIPLFSRFRNSEDRRNFISAGAAAGVSSAFGAPVGGLLFAMEEVSSFWNMKLSWQTFFCCMVSTFTTDLLNSAFTAFRYQGDFGLFKTNKYILFAVTRGLDLNIIGIIPAILIGIIGGFSGSLFTFVNLKIQRIRRKLLSKVKTTVGQKICRIGEPVVIMIIFGTVSVLLPMSFSCTSYSCPVNNTGDVNQQECLLGTQSEDNVERYTCPRSKLVNVDGVTYRKGTYNQVATLLFLTGEQAIAHLFSRNTHFELDVVPLLVVFAIYFILSCWAAGSSISSGLVVPMLFIGALYGRIVGRIFVDLVGVHLHDYWAWIDPGAFALLGAASFFGGVSRLTMSLTVIMVELTNDIQFLLLIMTSVMVAKWVGDFVTHPLYHALLEFKCIPFLDVEPIIIHNKRKTVSLEMFTCRNVMTSPVVTVPTRDSVSHLAHLLLETTHSGFPVVRNLSPEMTSTFCGLITRLELSVLLQNPQIFLSEDDVEEDEPELLDVSYDKFCISKIADAKRINDLLMTYIENERYKNIYVNIFPYMNQSAVSIQGQFSLHRTYIIFRSLGLRHMTIVDDRNQVVGILTRKDLMGFMLEERLHNVLNCELRPTNHIV